jgi:hypothetical protein
MKVRMSEPGYNSNVCYGYTELQNTPLWKHWKLRLQYWIVRYGFHFSDRLRDFIIKNKWSQLLVKN